jgi:hypothetical protein
MIHIIKDKTSNKILLKNLNYENIFKSLKEKFSFKCSNSLIDTLVVAGTNLISGAGNEIKMWSLEYYNCLKTINIESYSNPTSSLAIWKKHFGSIIILPSCIACSIWSGTILLFDKLNFNCFREIKVQGYKYFRDLLLLPNGNIACTAGQNNFPILIFDNDFYLVTMCYEHMDFINDIVNLNNNNFCWGY